MERLVARAAVTALHALLARAPDADKDSSSSGKGGSASPTKSSSSTAKTTGTSKGGGSGSSDEGGGSWIYTHVDLVVAASLCGVVAVMISLILVWWYLKQKQKKAQAAQDALEKDDAASDFESKGADVTTPLPSQAQQQADYSMYPHFNASKPPPPVQVSFDDASHHPAQPQVQQANPYEKQVGGGYSLGAISERSEELEHMDEGLYGRNNHGFQQQQQQDQQDEQQEYMQEAGAQHARSHSDPRDSYYYDQQPNSSAAAGLGGRLQAPPPTVEDRESMYSVQEKTRYI